MFYYCDFFKDSERILKPFLFQIVEIEDEVTIPVERADKRYFPLGRKQTLQGSRGDKNVPLVAAVEPRGLISDIVMQDAALHIYLRSVVQVCYR